MKTPVDNRSTNNDTLNEGETQMNNEVKGIDKGTIIRTILLAIALVNQSLVLAGYSPIPFAEAQLEAFLSGSFTAVMTVLAWWKNNDITRKARGNGSK